MPQVKKAKRAEKRLVSSKQQAAGRKSATRGAGASGKHAPVLAKGIAGKGKKKQVVAKKLPGATKVAGSKKVAAKKSAAKKSMAKRSVAKKSTAKRSAAKKPAPKRPASKKLLKGRKILGKKPVRRVDAAGRARAVPVPTVRFDLKQLDPLKKCGPGTSVELLFRVIERDDGRAVNHLVYFDRHGWYCDHGVACPAVAAVKKQGGHRMPALR